MLQFLFVLTLLLDMNKGFISVPVIIIILLAGTLVVGGGYTAYKINQIESSNVEKIAELESKLNQVSTTTTSEAVAELTNTTSSSSTPSNEEDVKPNDKESVKETVVVKEVVYVPQAPAIQEPEIQDVEVEKAPEVKEEKPIEIENVSPISVAAVRQTSYPDGYGGVYGAYELVLKVQANVDDIYIPMTTTDTVSASEIGFSYSIVGPEFRGVQNSDVSGCTNFNNNFCKFKVGQDKYITVTVWIYPDSDSNGNYSVNFGTVTYYEGDERKEFVVDRETAKINLYY